MGESENVTATPVSGASAPSPAPSSGTKENFIIPLLVWIVFGVLVGYGAYLLFLAPHPSPELSLNNSNINITPIITHPVNITTKIQLIAISESRCSICNSSSLLLSAIRTGASKLSIEINNTSAYDASSPEGQAIISKYSIAKVPTIVITGDTNASEDLVSWWAGIGGTTASDGSLVYADVYPPYYDLANNRIAGIVDVIELQASGCTECFNISSMTATLSSQQIGVILGNVSSYESNSSEGQALISKYNITRVPTMVLSADAILYPPIQKAWGQMGSVEVDGSLVVRSAYPPYLDLVNDTVAGKVSIIELLDQSCAECYNASTLYEGMKTSGGMVFVNRTSYDMNSTTGKGLVSKYNITAVPTIILSSDALAYPGFDSYWLQVGSTESDGWLVLREVGNFGTFRNLTSGNITNATMPTGG